MVCDSCVFDTGMIMGSFIACWLPFFLLYSISPVCPICGPDSDSTCVSPAAFSTAFWLGYSNSAFNPVWQHNHKRE